MLTHSAREGMAARWLPRPLSKLSKRQKVVLRMMAQGDTNAQIARQMNLSPATVSEHVRYILIKLNARSRAHAIHIAHREGLLR